MFFWLGIAYFSPTTILPLFVSYLTTSNVVIGAVPAVVVLAWSLPQLLGARALARQRSRKGYILRTAIWGRVPLAALVPITALLAVPHPTLALVLFLICFAAFRFTGGLNTPVYYDLVADVVDPRVRARFIGLSQFLGGAIAAAALVLGRAVLDAFPFPAGFVILFTVGLFFVTAALGFMWVVREPAQVPRPTRAGLGPAPGIVAAVGRALREDAAFRAYLASRVFVALASMAQAFFAVHARREMGASDGDVALFTAALLGAQTVSTLAWGAAANRLRLPPVLLGGTLLYLAATAVALAAPSLTWFALAFALSGMWLGALAVTDPGFPLALAEARGADRALYVAMANTVLSPVYVVAPLLGGAAADMAGYRATYVIALAAGAVACVLMLRVRR